MRTRTILAPLDCRLELVVARHFLAILAMKLHAPFSISDRLLPAIRIGQGVEAVTLSAGPKSWFLDGPFGSHEVTDYRPARGEDLVSAFEGLLSFMGAAASSFQYAERRGKDGMEGENADLFPREVTEALAQISSEIECVQCDLEQAKESESPLIEA